MTKHLVLVKIILERNINSGDIGLLHAVIRALVLFIALFVCGLAAQAQEAKKKDQSINIDWYQPEVHRLLPKDKAKVTLSGLSSSDAKIRLAQQPTVIDSKSRETKPVKLTKKERQQFPLTPREDGYFSIDLSLPLGVVQVPLQFSGATTKDRSYTLVVKVNKDKVLFKGEKDLKKSPFQTAKHEVWLGLGANFLRYDQEIPASGADVVFQNFAAPAVFLKGALHITPKWTGIFSFKSSPGKTTSSQNIDVNKGQYTWLTYSADNVYYPSNWRAQLYGLNLRWGFRLGLQHHNMPLLTLVESNSYNITHRDLTTFSGGGQLVVNKFHRLYFTTYMRYQIPVASEFQLNIKPEFAFDGSLGVAYRWSYAWRFGVFWYGQWHRYDFSDQIENRSGGQQLFFSNLELRAGYNF